jgi:LPS-assembly lipoprotein
MSSFSAKNPLPSPPTVRVRGALHSALTAQPQAQHAPSPKGGEGWGGGHSRRAFLAALLTLPACTFTPAYAPGGPAQSLQGSIRVDDPSDKNGFDLVERLEERLGRPNTPRYRLAYSITTNPIGVGITPDAATTRYNLTGSIDWSLSDMAGTRVAGGKVQNFTSYSATGSTVAGLAAEEDAALRLMRILADQIVTRLIAVSGTLP